MTKLQGKVTVVTSQNQTQTNVIEQAWLAAMQQAEANASSSGGSGGLPEQAKQALQFFANNPTLFSAIAQDAGGKHMFGPFFVSNANENTCGYLHTAGFSSDQMERLSAALSLCRHNEYSEAARETFMCTVWQLITENVILGTGGFLD